MDKHFSGHPINQQLFFLPPPPTPPGVAQGMTSLVASVYVSEVSSSNARGFLGTSNQIATALGVFVAMILTFGLNYKWMAVFGAANAALVAVIMAFMPESPRW